MNEQQDNESKAVAWSVVLTMIVACVVGSMMDSFFIGLITFIIGFLLSIKILFTPSKQEDTSAPINSAPVINPMPRTKKKRITFKTKLAGAQHHCDDDDIGGFLGYIAPEPDNEYDKNAIAVYRNNGKHVGYIPREDIASLKRWASQPSLPCIGYIFDGDIVEYWGRITIVDADPQQTELELVKIAYDMVVRDGAHILPEEFRVEGDEQPTSSKEWLEVLEARIKELSGDK